MPPTQTSSSTSIAHLAGKAFLVLVIRQVIAQSINIAGGIVVARLLSPSELGIFGIVTFVVILSQLLSDFGLSYTLIQQEAHPSAEDYSKVFTFQFTVIALLIAIIWIFSSHIAAFYHLPANGPLLIKIISLSIVPISLQALYAASLERHIAFKNIAYIEIFQSFLYNGLSILLVCLHYGIWSLIAAYLARTLSGACLILLLKKTVPHLLFDPKFIKQRLKKGVFIQGSSLISQAKDAIVPLYIGAMLGPKSVGYINWAGQLAFYPVIILNVLNRIYLPSFSRLKNSPDELRTYFSFVTGWTNRITLPLVVIVYCNAELIAKVIFGPQWLPAVSVVKIFCISNAFIPTSGPCVALLNAFGKPRATFFFAVVWFLLTWVAGVPLTAYWGIIGFSFVNIIVSSSSIIMFVQCGRLLGMNIFKTVAKPFIFSVLTGIILFLTGRVYNSASILYLVGNGMFGILLFGFLTVFFDKAIQADLRLLRKMVAKTLAVPPKLWI